MEYLENISSELDAIKDAAEFETECYGLTESWIAAGIGLLSVEPIFKFIETHPDIEYGHPGPLVHFIERLSPNDYREALLASLKRNPTMTTVWMLNRLINAEERQSLKANLMSALRRAATNVNAASNVRESASYFLKYQNS